MTTDDAIALAGWLGAHALAVFGVLLCAVLLAVALAVWVWEAHVLRRVQAAFAQPAVMLLNAVAGFAIVVAAALAFAEIAEHLGPGGSMSRFDEALAASIRSHAGAVTLRACALLTHFGDVRVLAALGVGVALWLAWCRQRALALGWVLALAGNALLNPTLKRIFERVRPVHDHNGFTEPGWSFPSGHTSGATVAYGMLAYVLLRTLPSRWHLPAVLGAAGLAFIVGSSRVFLQVHFLSDVVAGFSSGLAWLTVCILSVALSQRWRVVRSR